MFWLYECLINLTVYLCADPEKGGRGSGPPLENHKAIGFLSNTGPDPIKNHKATKPAFNVWSSSVRQRNTTFKWRFAGGPMTARC